MTPPVKEVAFSLFGIDIMWYGVLIALGFLVGIAIATKNAKFENMSEEYVQDLIVWIIPFAIIGARLYYVIFSWDYYSKDLSKILDIREGGLAIYGGIIAGIIVGYLYCRKKKISFLQMADLYMPGVAIGQAIGRWGNFINKEAYGSPTDFPISVLIEGKRYHATFLYESLGNVLIFAFLFLYLRKWKKNHGEVLSLYLILYGILRFFVEGLRMDSLYIGIFRVSQLLSLVLVVLGTTMYIKFRKKEVN